MIYEKKTLQILADQRLLSRYNNNIKPECNKSHIITNMNNHFAKNNIYNKFNNISKLMTYIVLIICYVCTV
jgi:hypothetical protein